MNCIVEGCTRKARLVAPSPCQGHHAQVTRYGFTEYRPIGFNREYQQKCEVPSCERLTKNARLCTPCRKKVNRYGLTVDALIALDGSCAVCHSRERLHVDHDHATGKVRGILCGNCNTALGLINENPETLRKLIQYLGKDNV